MSTARRTLVLTVVLVTALALASRSDGVRSAMASVVGPRVTLYLPAGGAHVGTVEPAAPAAAAPQPRPPAANAASARGAVSVGVEPSQRAEQGYVVEARLTTRDGKPLNETAVRFYDVVELLGTREMLIGSAITDGWGRASYPYLPAEQGRHEIIVRSAGGDPSSVIEGRATFDAAVVAGRAHERDVLPLSPLTARLPWAAGTVLLAVWALFLVALGGAVRGVLVGVPHATERIRRRIT